MRGYYDLETYVTYRQEEVERHWRRAALQQQLQQAGEIVLAEDMVQGLRVRLGARLVELASRLLPRPRRVRAVSGCGCQPLL